MKQYLTIKLLGFNDSERSKFESLLTIAENMLDIPWNLTEMNEADFYLLKGSLKSQMDQDSFLKTLSVRQCIFYSKQKNDGPFNEILVDRNNTPYLRSIVELFKSLSSNNDDVEKDTSFHQAENIQSVDVNQPLQEQMSDSDIFDPDQGVLGLLLMKQEGIQEYELNNIGNPSRLYIDSKNKHYYYQDDLEKMEFFFSGTGMPKQRTLSEEELQTVISNQNLRPLPITNLLWYGAFVSSKGRVMKGYRADDIIRLKRWPDISLPGSRKLIKLAAFMQSNAVDLMTIQQQTGVPSIQINDFVNACKVTDLIEYCQEAEVHEKNLDDNQRRLFAKIGKRLKQAENDQ